MPEQALKNDGGVEEIFGQALSGQLLTDGNISDEAPSDDELSNQIVSDPAPILEYASVVTDEQRAPIRYGENRFGPRYI